MKLQRGDRLLRENVSKSPFSLTQPLSRMDYAAQIPAAGVTLWTADRVYGESPKVNVTRRENFNLSPFTVCRIAACLAFRGAIRPSAIAS